MEFLRQQFVDAGVCFIAAIDEVDHHDIVFLSVAMATTDALFDALRIPREVEVNDQRAELQVDAFGPRLGRDHDRAAFLEMLDQGGTGIGGLRSRDLVRSFVTCQPILVDRLSTRIAIRAIKQHDALAIGRAR